MQSTGKKVSPAFDLRFAGLRSILRLLAVVCMFMFIGSQVPLSASGTLYFCCLDDWQGGGVCPPGQRLASYCSGGSWVCENCGTFFCVVQGTSPSTTCFE